jgi:hypothetical protein
VERESGLMREHTGLLRPQPGDDEIFMLARRKVHKSVDPATNSNRVPSVEMVHE